MKSAHLAIQCTCPDTQEIGDFLYQGESHREPGTRVSPVFSCLVEFYPWANINGWIWKGNRNFQQGG